MCGEWPSKCVSTVSFPTPPTPGTMLDVSGTEEDSEGWYPPPPPPPVDATTIGPANPPSSFTLPLPAACATLPMCNPPALPPVPSVVTATATVGAADAPCRRMGLLRLRWTWLGRREGLVLEGLEEEEEEEGAGGWCGGGDMVRCSKS